MCLAQTLLAPRRSLVLTWSCEESGRYLETFKTYENKDADLIKEKVPRRTLTLSALPC